MPNSSSSCQYLQTCSCLCTTRNSLHGLRLHDVAARTPNGSIAARKYVIENRTIQHGVLIHSWSTALILNSPKVPEAIISLTNCPNNHICFQPSSKRGLRGIDDLERQRPVQGSRQSYVNTGSKQMHALVFTRLKPQMAPVKVRASIYMYKSMHRFRRLDRPASLFTTRVNERPEVRSPFAEVLLLSYERITIGCDGKLSRRLETGGVAYCRFL